MDIENNCACLKGYYASESDLHCVECPDSNCKNCNNEGICLECSNSNLLPPKCE